MTEIHIELRREKAAELARRAGISEREIDLVFGPGDRTPQERARGMCALAAVTGRCCARGDISYAEASAMLGKVTQIVRECPSEAFLAWFNTRGDSDFAMARDFMNFQHKFGRQSPVGVTAIMDAFRAAVADRLGDSKFDVYEDTMSPSSRAAVSLELVTIAPPRRRNG